MVVNGSIRLDMVWNGCVGDGPECRFVCRYVAVGVDVGVGMIVHVVLGVEVVVNMGMDLFCCCCCFTS